LGFAAAGGLQYGARLHELRHDYGYEIISKTKRVRVGVGRQSITTYSWFCLLSESQSRVRAKFKQGEIPTQAEIDEIDKAVKVNDDSQPNLFDAEAKHRDDG
jgi:hypothetical protein